MTFNSDEKHGFIYQVIYQVIYKNIPYNKNVSLSI